MKHKPDHLIEELVRQKLEGKSYTEIRSELTRSGLTKEKISGVIREVDEQVLLAESGINHPASARQWYRAGLILSVTGLIISIAFNAGIFLNNLPAMAVYTPFILGILVMFYGRMLQRKKPAPVQKGPGKIRSKRPYK